MHLSKSLRTILTLMTGIFIFGFLLLAYITTNIDTHIRSLTFYTLSNFKNYTQLKLHDHEWNNRENIMSIFPEYGGNGSTGSSLKSPQVNHEIKEADFAKSNLTFIRTTTSSEKLPNKTSAHDSHSENYLIGVVSENTSMTFNTSLEVFCKESPFIECTQPTIHPSGKRKFKVAFLRQPDWHPAEYMDVSKCSYKQCEFVKGKVTQDTDVVVVYGVNLKDSFELQKRWSHQLYVVSMWESPVHMNSDYLSDDKSKWNHQFNITMNYRVDSDIFSPYGRLKFRPKSLDQRPNYYEIAKKKTKTAVWFVSHCSTQSKRLEYVRQMQKYVDVDIFGGCGEPCHKQDAVCNDISTHYKFYLSFENSLCTDYITEKFFKMFASGMHVIPVVRGGANYDKYFANFTYINADNFKNAKDLALYLKNLASDLKTYSEYLEYKDLYSPGVMGFNLVCLICEYLHTKEFQKSKQKTYNLKTWAGNGHCHNPYDM